MPCSDGGPSYEQTQLERHRIRGLAVGLCIACEALEKAGQLPAALAGWYGAHKAADAARDMSVRCMDDLAGAERVARQQGYSGVSREHPLSVAATRANYAVSATQNMEREESAKLSKLKPE